MAKNDAEINVGANGEAFTKEMAKLAKNTDTMANSITARLARLGGAWDTVKGPLAKLGNIGKSVFSGISDSVEKAAAQETLQVAFSVLLKGEEQALSFLEKLNEYAAQTPFSIDSISASAKTLLSMTSLGGDEALNVIKMLGDVSAMTGKDLNELAQIYAKAMNVGVNNELSQQLGNAGFDLKGYIAEIQGISFEEVGEKISKGVIGIEHFNAALKLATAEGGKFYEGTARLAETAAGKWSTMMDNVSQAMTRFGEGLLPSLKPAMDAITESIQNAVPAVSAFGEMFGEWLNEKIQDGLIPSLQDVVLHLPVIKKNIMEIADKFGKFVDVIMKIPNAIGAVQRSLGKLTSALSIYSATDKDWGESWKAAEQIMREEENSREAEMKREQEQLQKMIDGYNEKVEQRKKNAADRDRANADTAASNAAALDGTKKQLAAETALAEKKKADAAAEKKAIEDNAKAYENYQKQKAAWEQKTADKERSKKDIGRQQWELEQEGFTLGVRGELTPESIRAKMDELAEAGAETNKQQLEQLQHLLENWDALTEKKKQYQQTRSDEEAEMRIQALQAAGDERHAKEAQERLTMEKRIRELKEQGMSAAAAQQQAVIESEIRKAKEIQQKMQSARVEFIQGFQASVGGGGASYRLGGSQLEESKKHTQLMTDIYQFLQRNTGTALPYVLS